MALISVFLHLHIYIYNTCSYGRDLPDQFFQEQESLGQKQAHRGEEDPLASPADLLIIAGTSLTVFPAAGLPDYMPKGSHIVLLNRDPPPIDGTNGNGTGWESLLHIPGVRAVCGRDIRGLYLYISISIPMMSCFTWSGALESPYLLIFFYHILQQH